MTTDDALAYVGFLARRLELPLSESELWSAADRAVEKQSELAPLYAALAQAPVEGSTVFRPALVPERAGAGLVVDE